MSEASRARRTRRSKTKSGKPAPRASAERVRGASPKAPPEPKATARPKPNPKPPVERHPRLPARLTVPSRTPDQLDRPRLVNNIHENIHRKLFLISAPAGYGKSSLLAAFAAETDYPLAWLQLDETDRDLVALITDLT